LTIRGIQNRVPIPYIKVVVVKKYAVLDMSDIKFGFIGGGPKKVAVTSVMTTVGLAARKL
jgi:hypothetical protein